MRQSGDGRGLAEDTRNEVDGVHVPEVDIGVQHFFDQVFHLAAGEDEAAGRNVVVCGFDEDNGDELDREDKEGSEFSEVGFGSWGAREGKGGRTTAGGEGGQGGAVGMMGTCGLLNVKVILDMNPVLVLVLALVTVLEPVLE